MTSKRQLDANQKNSLKSTGPKSVEGKVAIRNNATRHGLLSKQVLLPNEEPTQFVEFEQRLRSDLEPEGELEQLLADSIIADFWRLRRTRMVEVGLFELGHYAREAEKARTEATRHTDTTSNVEAMLNEMLNPTVVTNEKKHKAALDSASEIEALKDRQAPALALTFVTDESGFANLSRYETGIMRGVLRTLHELQRLQSARLGGTIAAPVAVDVDVQVSENGR